MRPALLGVVLASLASCVGSQDNPTQVHDLRVLALSFEPPELFAASCQDEKALAIFASPVTLTALIADPAGGGREIGYELRACAHPSDRTCSSPQYSYPLGQGTTLPGELVIDSVSSGSRGKPPLLQPGLLGGIFDGGTPLLESVARQDTYKGLGGIRLPVVLHLSAGEEEIFAQKLLVFSCKLLPEMTPNHTPKLPGLLLEGEPWAEGATPLLQGEGPFSIEPEDFLDRQEDYVVPSYTLKPVQLSELWKIAWHADLGQLGPGVTGGSGVDGLTPEKHQTQWSPGPDATEREVTFWAVVRDGRGGVSWLTRKALWKP